MFLNDGVLSLWLRTFQFISFSWNHGPCLLFSPSFFFFFLRRVLFLILVSKEPLVEYGKWKFFSIFGMPYDWLPVPLYGVCQPSGVRGARLQNVKLLWFSIYSFLAHFEGYAFIIIKENEWSFNSLLPTWFYDAL